MKNVYLIPTEKPSRLVKFFTNKYHLSKEILPIQDEEQYQHIYITSDEEIKEGVNQWYLDKLLNKPRNSSGSQYGEKQNVIILTTDQDLIKDGVQAIDNGFLVWFVKNPSCESLEIEKTFVTNSGLGYQEYATLDSNFKVIEINAKIPQTSYYLGKVTILNTYEYVINYKITIPKEEPKIELYMGKYMMGIAPIDEQETELEEAAENAFNDFQSKNPIVPQKHIRPFKLGFANGAKWQENDCVQFINKLEDGLFDGWSEEAKSGYLTACMTIKNILIR